LAHTVADPLANKEVQTLRINIASVVINKTSSHKHPNLGKAPNKNKDHKCKSDTSSPASLPAATNNNVRKCYICSDPNHLANACPQKSKHKQNAKTTKLKANKSFFLALFKSSFSSQNEQACASRMIDAWDEDAVPPASNHASLQTNATLVTHMSRNTYHTYGKPLPTATSSCNIYKRLTSLTLIACKQVILFH
jgi:hypothetical protein